VEAVVFTAALVADHVAHVLGPDGQIVAVLDDTEQESKRDNETLLSHASVMAHAMNALQNG
jgi:hypothetical protein